MGQTKSHFFSIFCKKCSELGPEQARACDCRGNDIFKQSNKSSKLLNQLKFPQKPTRIHKGSKTMTNHNQRRKEKGHDLIFLIRIKKIKG
jgi:hypothetical protein